MTAKNIRLVIAGVVSVYGIVASVDHASGVHLPAAVAAVLTAAAPVMLALQHWLSDPSTGNPTTPPVPQVPVAVPATPVAPPAPTLDDVTAGARLAAGGGVVLSPPQPFGANQFPVPPPEWSTLSGAAPAPVAPPAATTPNPAPPAPA